MAPSLLSFLFAQVSPGGAASPVGTLIMMGCLFAGMYFLIIAPQRKKQKEQEKMIASLSSGDKVVTIGGFHGIVQSVKDNRIVLKIAEGTKVELEKSAIQSCLNKDASEGKDAPEKKDSK
jgi:preprotein translocase subunit YajC